ncbi:ATP-binding cassette domain-containing protein [Streptomyces sp900116325]|uniref:ATP-binding cassette domain-containing protein n=1 Tax=Streptomyces sp. 900116325 TaxID=3154295 RepID=UPI00331FC7D9
MKTERHGPLGEPEQPHSRLAPRHSSSLPGPSPPKPAAQCLLKMPLRRSTSCRHDARLTLQASARVVSANHVQAATTRHRSHRPRLRIGGDCKGYGGRQVLRDVDLDVSAGTLVGVGGENGAGKNTLLEIAVGHVAPDRGTVTRTGAVGYCPQRAVLNDAFTVGQHLRLFQVAYRLTTLERADELLALTGCRRQQAGELSGGTRQKLNLLIALMGFFLIIMLSLVDTGLQNPVFKSSWM